jgi:hypothetical protein
MKTIEIKETKLKSTRINQERFTKEAGKIFDLEVKRQVYIAKNNNSITTKSINCNNPL